MRYLVVILIFIHASSLGAFVLVDGTVNRKRIFDWQSLEYVLSFQGDLDSFKVDGINEKLINDFKIVSKSIVSSVVHKENQAMFLKHDLKYTLKPIKKGVLYIPELEANYFIIDSSSVLNKTSKKLPRSSVRVFGVGFLIAIILEWVIIIGLSVFIYWKIAKRKKRRDIKNIDSKHVKQV